MAEGTRGTLKALGFQRCESEWGLHVVPGNNAPKAVMLVYVDDWVIPARTTSTIHDILNRISSKWTLSSLGPTTYVLGMRVTHDRPNKTNVLSQAAYIDILLKRFPGFSVIPSHKLDEDDFETRAVLTPY